MTRLRLTALVLGAALLAACDKGGPQDITGSLPGSRIKFFNFSVNAPSVNFYAGDTKITAISSTACQGATTSVCRTTGVEATTGTAFGAAGLAGLYSAVAPGSYSLSGRIATVADNGVPVTTLATTLEAGKAYSFYMSGLYDATAKRAEGFIIEDAFPPDTTDFTASTIRFVNAIPNAGPLQLIVRNQTTSAVFQVGSAVAYKSATPFVKFVNSGLVDLIVRNAGSTTDLFTRTGVTFDPGRTYTVASRGDITVTSTTAATRPQLDVTANR